jgi:type III secretion system FlhB-like substrate exporter
LNQEIPAEVYKAVAEILAFIYRLSNRQLAK